MAQANIVRLTTTQKPTSLPTRRRGHVARPVRCTRRQIELSPSDENQTNRDPAAAFLSGDGCLWLALCSGAGESDAPDP